MARSKPKTRFLVNDYGTLRQILSARPHPDGSITVLCPTFRNYEHPKYGDVPISSYKISMHNSKDSEPRADTFKLQYLFEHKDIKTRDSALFTTAHVNKLHVPIISTSLPFLKDRELVVKTNNNDRIITLGSLDFVRTYIVLFFATPSGISIPHPLPQITNRETASFDRWSISAIWTYLGVPTLHAMPSSNIATNPMRDDGVFVSDRMDKIFRGFTEKELELFALMQIKAFAQTRHNEFIQLGRLLSKNITADVLETARRFTFSATREANLPSESNLVSLDTLLR